MKVTVITATWNSSATIRHTMESVLSQSYDNIEHIIVDGNSTDNTMAIVHELEPRYKGRLRYISEKDNGLYDAMNKGIAMATGDVIGILNSDDFYSSDSIITNIVDELEDKSIDAVYGDIHYVHNENLKKCVRYYSSRFFHPSTMRLGFMPAHPSFYCRREVYEKYGGFRLSYKIAADFECLLRLLFVHKIRTSYIPADFVTMRTGGASTNGISSHIQILRDHQKAFRDNGVYSNIILESLRYIYKIIELIATKVTRKYC